MSAGASDTTSVIVATIAAVASVADAIITGVVSQRARRRNDAQLELLRAELQEAQKERDAQRDYRYEATKRLYAELQPLLFQLAEACESAYRQIKGLARAARQGRLDPGEGSWLKGGYFLRSTVYRLLVPVALVDLIERRLTYVDLTLDAALREQYRFARAVVNTWNSGFDFTTSPPAIDYRPHDADAERLAAENPPTFGLQHLFAGQIDRIAGRLIVSDGNRERRLRFGEFEDNYEQDPAVQSDVAPVMALFTDFHPRTSPILWRMLMAQVHLYKAISLTFSNEGEDVAAPAMVIGSAELESFRWDDLSGPEAQAVKDGFASSRAWLESSIPTP